jgi:hypothetical protein
LAVSLALFLIRPGAQWLRAHIVASVSSALGQQVEIESVRLRLFPQPGFDLQNFIVHDDPAFSAEPVLRAQEVAASLRLTSLLRGRLEIARLDLTEPSVNLVRDSAGHWNLENLLERAARTPIAPTSKAKSEVRPGFPYIEADSGRINFKLGQEKKPYALTQADFAFWQDSENQWGMRLRAQPVRTDFNLGDTGVLRVTGAWQRAESLHRTPLNFSLQWDHAQLGQVSTLVYGRDKGWRGSVKLAATVTGTPADLNLKADASVQDFRRYDIPGGGNLLLAGECTGHYSTEDRLLSNLACEAPVGRGALTLGGEVSFPGPRRWRLELAAQQVPIEDLVLLARHAKKDIPSDLKAGGKVNAHFKAHRDSEEAAVWEGNGEATDFQLGSALNKIQLTPGRIPFTLVPGGRPPGSWQRSPGKTTAVPAEAHLEIGPLNLALGRPSPATLRGWLSRFGYSFSLQGDAELRPLLQLARTLGLPASQPAADGFAKVDVQIAGSWAGFAAPTITGTAQLRSVRAELRGVNAPLEIASATLVLSQDETAVRNLAASLDGTAWTGSLGMPRHCATYGACPVRFDLHADEIATDKLHHLFTPRPGTRPWYRWLSPAGQPVPSPLTTLRAAGKLTVSKLVIHKLAGIHAAANVELQSGKLHLSDLRAEVLGGKHTGEWTVDFVAKPPQCKGSGTLQKVALEQLSGLMGDGWITGTAMGTYRLSASGYTLADLLSSADADLKFEAHDGSLPHITLTGSAAPLHMHGFAGRLALRDGKFQIEAGKLEAAGGIYQVSGTASLGRKVEINLLRDAAHGFSITGTLTEPHVTPVTAPETQAALKP